MASQHIDATRRAADKLYRRQAVEIRNPKLGTWVVLDVLGGGQTKGVTASAVALDYDAKVSLGIQGDQEFELVIRPAPWWRVYQYYFKHPDRGTRVGAQLGVLGLGVSIVSFLLGVLTSLVF